jgi:hypothetical protein
LALLATACGGSSSDSNDEGVTATTSAVTATNDSAVTATTGAVTATDGDVTATTSATPAQPEVGEAGVFTVNGTTFAVTLLNRCIPFRDEPGNVDLQALSQGSKLNLALSGTRTDVSVDGAGIQEMFGSIAFGENPVVAASDIAGDRWTGSAAVGDSLGSGDIVELTWDVMVPAEVRDCSL